jgi:hypothetical protein
MRLLAIVAALLVAAAQWASTEHANAATDPSGYWDLQFTGGYSGPCSPTVVVLNGTTMSVSLPCIEVRNLSGAYDKGSGSFSLTGQTDCTGYYDLPFTMSGTVSGGGTTMSGDWDTICLGNVGGTFSGMLTGPLPTATPTRTATLTRTPTPVITMTPTRLPPGTPEEVGGISRDPDLGASQLQAPGGSSGPNAGLIAVAGAMGAFALASGAWYVRKRRVVS